jgi:hypothetical protein
MYTNIIYVGLETLAVAVIMSFIFSCKSTEISEEYFASIVRAEVSVT